MSKIVFFSGGLTSFAVAHSIKDDKPLLYFTDTKWEDEDLYRFIYEASDKLKLPLLIHSMGIDPVELMIKQRIIFNSRIGNCSAILKMKVASDFLKKGKKPQIEEWYNKQYLPTYFDFDKVNELYFGIGFDEFHRVGAIKKNWQPYDVKFPLVESIFNYDELLAQYGIKKPRMYLKGFTHNNCKGRCVKAGKGHYKLLYNEDKETFNEINQIEHYLSIYVGAYHYLKNEVGAEYILQKNEDEIYKWYRSGYKHKPNLSFSFGQNFNSIIKSGQIKTIKQTMDKKQQFDLFGNTSRNGDEIGGCGCFVDYDENNLEIQWNYGKEDE